MQHCSASLCRYLAHHELKSNVIIIVITIIITIIIVIIIIITVIMLIIIIIINIMITITLCRQHVWASRAAGHS